MAQRSRTAAAVRSSAIPGGLLRSTDGAEEGMHETWYLSLHLSESSGEIGSAWPMRSVFTSPRLRGEVASIADKFRLRCEWVRGTHRRPGVWKKCPSPQPSPRKASGEREQTEFVAQSASKSGPSHFTLPPHKILSPVQT